MKPHAPLLGLGIALVLLSSARVVAADRRPNILVLVADEFRHDCLGVAGHPVVKTPNLDALARGGVRFAKAYAAGPVCSPSRATLFTGRYPQVHGVTQNNLPFKEGEVTLPQMLRAQGYTTAMVGKLHLQGYESWFDSAEIDTEGNSEAYRAFLRDRGREIKGAPNIAAVPGSLVAPDRTPLRVGTSVLPEDLFPEAWQADRAIDFIRRQKGKDRPWFLYLSMLKPHSEFVVPAPYDTMYPAGEMKLPATFVPHLERPADFVAGRDEAKARKKARDDGPGSPARVFINDPDILRAVIGHYYGAVTMVDKHMGRVIAALDEVGARDGTIVLFTADHGNMLGERNRMFKGVMYEASARVPLILRGPGVPAGRVSDAVLDNSAVTPTLLDLAGLPIPSGVQGKTLVPALRGGEGPGAAFSYLRDKMVRRGDWKLILPLDRGRAPELYNLAADPAEQDNLYNKPEAGSVQRELTALIDGWMAQAPPAVELPTRR
jgi:arylsulfatase A-like enzyme